MRPGDEGAPAASLTTDTILGQIEAAVLVTDRLGHLRYANPYAAALFGLPDDARRLAGLSIRSLMCEEDDPGGAIRQVLAGGAWSRLFCGNLGVELPQLKVLGSVMCTEKVDGGPEISASGGLFANSSR